MGGEFLPCAIHNPANAFLVRYCFGGAMAGRLGSTEFVNTIVIAHPSNLNPAQIRAIKVNLPPMVCLSHDFTYVPRSLRLGPWPKVKYYCFPFCTTSLYYTPQMTMASKIKMSRPPRPYSRSRRRNLIMLTMNSRFTRVCFFLAMRARLVQSNPDDA